MTMKPRLSLADARGLLNTKVAQAGLSLEIAERIHDRISTNLSEDTSRFHALKTALGVNKDATTLEYNSVLWPGFEFRAHAGVDGSLESAGYTHIERYSHEAESPTALPAWSVDVPEFDDLFGPLIQRGKRQLFDHILPAYEEYEFSWNGDHYGARFLWGLFLSSSVYWE